MNDGTYIRQLWRSIADCNLDARYPDLAHVRLLIEHNLLDDDVARDYLMLIEPYIEHAKDHPHALHRPPTQDELIADGPWDIEIGSLVDRPGVPLLCQRRRQPRRQHQTVLIHLLDGPIAHPEQLHIGSGIRWPKAPFKAGIWFVPDDYMPDAALKMAHEGGHKPRI